MHLNELFNSWDNNERERMSPWDMEPIPEGSKCVLDSCPCTKQTALGPWIYPLELFLSSCLSGGGRCWSSCDPRGADSSSLQAPGRRMGGPFQRWRMWTSNPGDWAAPFPRYVWREKGEGLTISGSGTGLKSGWDGVLGHGVEYLQCTQTKLLKKAF